MPPRNLWNANSFLQHVVIVWLLFISSIAKLTQADLSQSSRDISTSGPSHLCIVITTKTVQLQVSYERCCVPKVQFISRSKNQLVKDLKRSHGSSEYPSKLVDRTFQIYELYYRIVSLSQLSQRTFVCLTMLSSHILSHAFLSTNIMRYT
jgi:hypothetical protein